MDKKSKEALRRYKKARQQESSSDSSSSDSSSSSSYSSSDSEHHHRKKKSMRRASSSDEERRKREKRELCQKKLEAKKQHLKRKLKEAKLRKRAAFAAAALNSHSYRSLSPATQAKIKKIAEKEKLRTASKEHREREKHRARERERHRESRSPSKLKVRLHQETKRQKSPPRMHHQLMSREKIIIQTRNRDRTPSEEREARQRHEHKLRHEEMLRERERRDRDRERAEREAARDKERAEALARCQERQRERDRLAREKIRREEEEKKYGSSAGGTDRLLPARLGERDLALTRSYASRERSLEAVDRSRHLSKRELDLYERDHEYLDSERRGLLERDDLRREHRDYVSTRHRELSPEAYPPSRLRDPRDLYPEEERERTYKRSYMEESRERDHWMDPREVREREGREYPLERDSELVYTDERERLIRDRERKMATRGEWKEEWQIPREREWEEAGPSSRAPYSALPKRGGHSLGPSKVPPREKRPPPVEADWDAKETKEISAAPGSKIAETQRDWIEHDQRVEDAPQKPPARTWQTDWREGEEATPHVRPPHLYMHPHGAVRGRGGYRRGGLIDHGERNPQPGVFRPHPPPLMTLPIHHPPGPFHVNPRFPHKRPMTYVNMNLAVNIRKQQAQLAAAKAAAQASAVAAATTAVAAAKAAAQSAANATTNPSILGQVIAGKPLLLPQLNLLLPNLVALPTPEKVEISTGENLAEKTEAEKTLAGAAPAATSSSLTALNDKASGELSEISDSEDDILNKVEVKTKPEEAEGGTEASAAKNENFGATDSNTPSVLPGDLESPKDLIKEEGGATPLNDKEDDVKILDFEEISDAELEEENKNKGMGDALGVDWASLIAETKRQAESSTPDAEDQFTSAKQRWQPHHLILNLGISMNMAGEDYAKNLIRMAKMKRDEELNQIKVKQEEIKSEDSPKEAITPEEENSAQIPAVTNEEKPLIKEEPLTSDSPLQEPEEQEETSSLPSLDIDVDNLHPLACVQVAERRRLLARQKLITNVCGPNSRALSARQDLQLRRQLCGLPAREFGLGHPIAPPSEKLKSLALAAFQRTLEVK